MPHRVPNLLALALGLGLACGGKDTGIDSGLPPDKQGSALTPSEQTSLCEAAGDYLAGRISGADWVRFDCTGEALGQAAEAASDIPGQIAACKMLRDQCVAETTPDESQEFECSASDGWSTCTATVAQLETCLGDAADLLDRVFNDFTCDVLDPAKAMELQQKYGDFMDDYLPPSCDVVIAECPAALGEDDSMTPTPAVLVRPHLPLRR